VGDGDSGYVGASSDAGQAQGAAGGRGDGTTRSAQQCSHNRGSRGFRGIGGELRSVDDLIGRPRLDLSPGYRRERLADNRNQLKTQGTDGFQSAFLASWATVIGPAVRIGFRSNAMRDSAVGINSDLEPRSPNTGKSAISNPASKSVLSILCSVRIRHNSNLAGRAD
jgi:hypothetical protein